MNKDLIQDVIDRILYNPHYEEELKKFNENYIVMKPVNHSPGEFDLNERNNINIKTK